MPPRRSCPAGPCPSSRRTWSSPCRRWRPGRGWRAGSWCAEATTVQSLLQLVGAAPCLAGGHLRRGAPTPQRPAVESRLHGMMRKTGLAVHEVPATTVGRRARGGGEVMMGLDEAFDAIAWRLARHAVDVVRYQPRQLDLALACGVWQPETAPAARWLAEARNYPGVVQALGLPHAALRAVAGVAARWFGPTASVLVRWSGGAVAATSDQSLALALQRRFRSRVHPGMLVPHLHAVAVLAADMRGFSHLTR